MKYFAKPSLGWLLIGFFFTNAFADTTNVKTQTIV